MSDTYPPSAWKKSYADACRAHPDLVAVFESARGRLALLLRQTLVPIDAEAEEWGRATRTAAGRIIRDLRAVGVVEPIVLLQHRSLKEIAHILCRWACRYDGDPIRRRELSRVAQQQVADLDFIATTRRSGMTSLSGAMLPVTRTREQERFLRWYEDMTPCWAGATPPTRRTLILLTHRWIAAHALGSEAALREAVLRDLVPGAAVTRLLEQALPDEERAAWRPWIALVVADLRRALAWPRRSTESWRRWLFLIPYSVPVPIAAAHADCMTTASEAR
jgi:hypothetical protein